MQVHPPFGPDFAKKNHLCFTHCQLGWLSRVRERATKMFPLHDWQAGTGYWLEDQPGLRATVFESLYVDLSMWCVLPYGMVAGFQVRSSPQKQKQNKTKLKKDKRERERSRKKQYYLLWPTNVQQKYHRCITQHLLHTNILGGSQRSAQVDSTF